MIRSLLIIMIILFGLSIQNAFAQVWGKAIDSTTAPAELSIPLFQESDFTSRPWLQEYTNIIVINKTNEGSQKQTLRLYVHGQLQLQTKISSGREKFEAGCKPGQEPKRDHCSNRAYWSTTPVGYFDVDTLDQHYFSNLWQTWMPWAVFFEDGIATHQAPAGTEGKLGERASGGCIRMHPDKAPIIFNAVQSAGQGLVPVIRHDGSVAKTQAGDIIRHVGYKSLYIVENVIVP